MDLFAVTALGDLLEDAQSRIDDTMHDLPEDAVKRELAALDALWAHYQELLDSCK